MPRHVRHPSWSSGLLPQRILGDVGQLNRIIVIGAWQKQVGSVLCQHTRRGQVGLEFGSDFEPSFCVASLVSLVFFSLLGFG